MERYILGADGSPEECYDIVKWGRWLAESDRRIAYDVTGNGDVSTVFLGIDHSYNGGDPVLWETLVFGGPLDQEMERYASLASAIAGHARMVDRVNAAK